MSKEGMPTEMFERLKNPQGNGGSDALMMCLSKAHFPETYREVFPDIKAEEQAKTLYSELKKRARTDKPTVSANS